MSLNMGLRYSINQDDAQWVRNVALANGTTRYVFGCIDQKTMSINTRFNYTMTPTLSLQVYAEPGRAWRLEVSPTATTEQKAKLTAWIGQ